MQRPEIGRPVPTVSNLGISFVFALLEKGFGNCSVCYLLCEIYLLTDHKAVCLAFLLKHRFLLVGAY